MDNLEIYNAGRVVPEEAQKSFNNGKFSGTDINPMWRIKKLTELFGAAGIGWYTEILSERCEEHADMTIAIVDINLYIKVNGEWSKPIYGTGGNVILRKGSVSDEGYKMAYTDALSVACKALGIGADIYFGKDKTKYTANDTPETKAPQKALQKPTEPFNGEPPTNTIYVCERCKQPIISVTGKDGSILDPKTIVEFSQKHHGKNLCADCQMELRDGK